MQLRYWILLSQFRFSLFYYQEHLRRNIDWNKATKIITAILTASSVAGWKIWEQFSTLWTVIISVSQVVLILNEFLPFETRVSDISKLVDALSYIFGKMENRWFDVQKGKLTDDQINDLMTEYNDIYREVKRNLLKNDYLKHTKTVSEQSTIRMKQYMNKFKGVVDDGGKTSGC
jgi:hypothetical protein